MPNPTMPPTVTDTVSILRLVFNAGTKQSVWTTVYSNVPAFINDNVAALVATGMSPQYRAIIVVAQEVDLRDGDRLTGYSPVAGATDPICQIGHVSGNLAPGMPRTTTGVRVAYIRVLERAA